MEYKYNIGDEVEVINSGDGVAREHIGKKVKIVQQGKYSGCPGYKVSPAIGNSLTGNYDGMIGENTFKLVEKKDPEFKEGDWVRAKGNIFSDFKIGKIVEIHSSYYKVDFINHPEINVDRKDWPTMRKALSHEIPAYKTPTKETSIEELMEEAKRRFPPGTVFRAPDNGRVYTCMGGYKEGSTVNGIKILCDCIERVGIMQYLYLRGEWAQISSKEYIEIPNIHPVKWEMPTILSAYQENKGVERLPKEVQFRKQEKRRRELL